MNPTPKDPFLPEPDAAAYLSPFVPRLTLPSSSWESAVAELYLHLPELAVESLAALDGTTTDTVETAALRLLALEQTGRLPSDVLACTCRKALMQFGYHERLVELALIHFVDAKEFRQALDLWSRFEAEARESVRGNRSTTTMASFLHNVACALVGESRHAEALPVLAEAAQTHFTPADLLMDHDLRHFWQNAAERAETGFSEEEVRTFGSPSFRRILEQANKGRILRTLCTSAVQEILPAHFRPWFRRSLSSHWQLESMCPAEIRRSYFEWLEDLRRQKLALLHAILNRSGE